MKGIINRNSDLFGYDLFDFDNLLRPWFNENELTMRTDIKEAEGNYVMDIELPGYEKEEIEVNLDKGYLIVKATKKITEEDKKTNFIRKERRYGSVSRSFYVGENLKEEDVNANYANGILTLTFPKEAPAKIIEKKRIQIG